MLEFDLKLLTSKGVGSARRYLKINKSVRKQDLDQYNSYDKIETRSKGQGR